MEQTPTSRPAAGLSERGKIIACWLGACLLFTLIVGAADITPGYTFASGEKNITHTKLNDAASGTINTTFITGKGAQTAVGADSLVYYANADAAFRKTTLTTLFANAPAINGLYTVNSTGDFSVNTSKFTVSATTGNTAVGGNLTVATNLSVTGTTTLTGTVSATNAVTLGNTSLGTLTASGSALFLGSISGATTLALTGAATLYGNVTLGDAAGDTITVNGTLAGTLQGTPTVSLTSVTLDTANDKVLIQDASDSSKLKIATLSGIVSTFTTNASVTDGKPIDVAHGLGGVPDSVAIFLQCTNAERGYAVGDYVVAHAALNASWRPVLTGGGNSTNVFVMVYDSANLNMFSKTNAGAAIAPVTALTNWNVRVTATRKQ